MSEPVDIHTWFSLSYANYLVMPRSVLQSMPVAWQHQFTALLDEADRSFAHLDWSNYDVRVLKRQPEWITPTQPCDECQGDGYRADDDSECIWCNGDGEGEVTEEDSRYETSDEVGFRTDPIPHYNRGRTVLEPKNA